MEDFWRHMQFLNNVETFTKERRRFVLIRMS